MAKDIEQLSIKIEADAHNAYSELDRLIKNVDALSASLRGFDGSKMINDLKEIANSTKAIKTSSINKQLTGMANAMNAYQKASAKSAQGTMSFTTWMGKFGGVMGTVTGAMSKVNDKINSFIFHSNKASKSTKNFAQTVGLLYARFFLLIRGMKSLVGMVKASMDYVEVMNYFNTSFDQIAKDSVSGWKEAGYDSADAYYKSFSERAEKVTKDMSGFFKNNKGLLESTGMKSLGMNPSEMIQYQTQFAQISNSMGTTGEQALKLSEVLTKLGADLASVRNMEFEDVWQDMTSGLVGKQKLVA